MDIPTSYSTFLEFVSDFKKILDLPTEEQEIDAI